MQISKDTAQKASLALRFDLALIIASACFIFLLLAYYLSLSQGGVEPDFLGHVLGRDFLNVYTAGELLRDDQAWLLFDGKAYHQNLQVKLGEDYPAHNWSYPPTMFWISRLSVWFDYLTALALWHFCGVLLLGLALAQLDLRWWWVLLVIFSPAGLINIIAGQNGFYTAALIVFAFSLAKRSSGLAGLSWAFLTIKPHLGAIALPYLFVNRQWKVIAAGALAFGVLVSATVLVWGINPWISFLTYTAGQQTHVLETWTGLMFLLVPTGFMQGRMLGLPVEWAYALHGVYAAVGLVLAIRAWPGRQDDTRTVLTWFVATTFVVLPYSFLYDLVILQVVLLLWRNDLEALFQLSRLPARIFFVLAWVLLFISMWVMAFHFVQLLPLLLFWMLWSLGQQKRRERTDAFP